jgi:hypothetical protein
MAVKDKIFYNKASASKLGWEPSWFCSKEFDEKLITNIRKFQKEYGLSADGLCGPMTFRRASTEYEAELEKEVENVEGNHLICEGELVPIEWDKVANLRDDDNLALPKGFKQYKKNKRNVKMIVTHFDVCLSAKSCARVLEKKGISSHFVIDNDGTIYQMVDTQHEGWHAGNRKVNKSSIGIDISNAVYAKYQKWYRRKGFGPRPLLEKVKVHNSYIKECLGFYPVQLEAYKVLVKTLCSHYDIPIQMPMDDSGNVLLAEHKETKIGKFSGIVNHFHVTRNKWDVANLDWDEMLSDLKD